MSLRPQRVAALAAGLLLAAACAGCGDEDPETVDASQLEQQIAQDLSSSTAQIATVSCPDGIESETGAKFTCGTELSGGGSAKVAVTQNGPAEFSYSFKPGTVELAGQSVDKELEGELATRGFPEATVNCPDRIKVEAGTTVTCPAAGAGGGAAAITFEFSDSSGTIEQSSVDTGS